MVILGCQLDIHGKTEPQLKICLHQIGLWGIFLIDLGGFSPLWVVPSLSSWAGWYQREPRWMIAVWHGHIRQRLVTQISVTLYSLESLFSSSFFKKSYLWLLGIELITSVRAVSARNCWAHRFTFFLFLFFFLVFGDRVSWLSWNSFCRPGWPPTQKSTCLYLPNAGIKGVRHHSRL